MFTSQLTSANAPIEHATLRAGAPLLLAAAVCAAGIPLLHQLAPDSVTTSSSIILIALALVTAAVAATALLRMSSDPILVPFVTAAAAATALLALAPLDRPAASEQLVTFLFVAPWRYALPPLVVHAALEIGWAHRRERWVGWVVGWYVVQAAMYGVAIAGLLMGESSLVDVVDALFRARIVEPASIAIAVCALLFALIAPHSLLLRRSLSWALAAVVFGAAPLLLSRTFPMLAVPIDGSVTVDRIALAAFPVLLLCAMLALPFRDAAARDLAAYRLALPILETSDLTATLNGIAEWLHAVVPTRGVAIRLTEPTIEITVGDITASRLTTALVPASEVDDDARTFTALLGRSNAPLGEVRLEGRHEGTFGVAEREWIQAMLTPVADMLRVRRRQIALEAQRNTTQQRLLDTVARLGDAARELPRTIADNGVAVPPPVDAREVLAQLGDGVTGVARHGEGLAIRASETRDRARSATDAIARALDALAALHEQVSQLARHGDTISSSNETVNGIAFRTNLVANNAALEATRAGATGRTFGILAEEVRRLAETTASTSADIGKRTAAMATDASAITASLETTRSALAEAVRNAEAAEAAAQRLNEAALELEDTARSIGPAVNEANAVARRRSARDQHLTSTLDRFLTERAELSRAITRHRDAIERMTRALGD